MTRTITIAEILHLEDIQVQLRQMESCSETSSELLEHQLEVADNVKRGYQFYKECLREVS